MASQNPIRTTKEPKWPTGYGNPSAQLRDQALHMSLDMTSEQIRRMNRPFIAPRRGFQKHTLNIEDMFALANPKNLRIGFSGYEDNQYSGSFRNVTSTSW